MSLKELIRRLREWVAKQNAGTVPAPEQPTGPAAWPQACARLNCAMATPMLSMTDTGMVGKQAAQLKAAGFNSVAALVDLQPGRPYIQDGRTATALTDKGRDNLDAILSAGLTPLIIIRNDWAARTGKPYVPSCGGSPGGVAFYSQKRMENEIDFVRSLEKYFPHVHLQLSIESGFAEAAAFALDLAQQIRKLGFAGRLIVNPYGEAVAAHDKIKASLALAGVEWARSWHGDGLPPDKIWNTDGNAAITDSNFAAWRDKLKASQREFILWTNTLANSPDEFPMLPQAGSVPATPPAANAGANLSDAEARALMAQKQFMEGADRNSPLALMQFKRFGSRITHVGGGCKPGQPASEDTLWKPKSDSNGNLVVILPCHVGTFAAVSVNGERVAGMSLGNGWRPTIRFSKPGSSYGSSVRLVVEGVGSAIIANGGTRTTFILSGAGTIETPSEPDAPPAADQNALEEGFSWIPDATGVTMTVPREWGPWKCHVFTLRHHVNLVGPLDGAGPYRIQKTGEQLRNEALAANDYGNVLAFVKLNNKVINGEKSAGWRIIDPRLEYRGNASMLPPGKDH